MTLEAWVKPSAGATAWHTVMMKEREDGLSYALYSDNAASRPTSWIRVGTSDRSVNGTAAVPATTWPQRAVTYDATTIRLYVNGTQVATAPSSGNLETSDDPLRIGGNL